MFENGREQIRKQMDIVEIMRKQMLFEVLFKLKFSKLERYFLRRNHSFALSSHPNQPDPDSTLGSGSSD